MPPRASASPGSAAGDAGQQATATAAAAAAGASSASAAAQPPGTAQVATIADEKIRWMLAVPPEQRPPSMQATIDSCDFTSEAIELLEAAPLAQLSGPAQLRALLLLLKAQWCLGGQSPALTGFSLLGGAFGEHVPQQAKHNLIELLCLTTAADHPELQPLFSAASLAAHATHLCGLSVSRSQVASLANSREPYLASIAQRARKGPDVSLVDVADVVGKLLRDIRQERPLLQQQLAGIGGGLLTVHELERELQMQLGVVHTAAATPDGAYCGGRIDEQHTAAGRASFTAALELSDGDARSAGLLILMTNLLRRTGAVAEAEAALRRAVAYARASGDPYFELNASASLLSVIPNRDGWSYGEVEGLLAAMQRCLKDTKPWLSSAMWSGYRERVHEAKKHFAQVRLALPATYASQPLPGQALTPPPGGFTTARMVKTVGACSCCGGQFMELKFCARCRIAKYCSRQCQVKHWKAGHKAECVPLAARTGGGGGFGTSGSRGG